MEMERTFLTPVPRREDETEKREFESAFRRVKRIIREEMED